MTTEPEQFVKPSSPSPEQSGERAAAQPQKPKRADVIAEGFRNRTKGERLFNRLTYTGVGFFGVTAVSVLLTWILRDHPKSSAKYESLVKKTIERFPSFGNIINSNATIATLFTGGTIVSVLPIKWLEDNKASIVKKFDRHYYGDDKIKNDPEILEAHREMEALPKQTWASVFSSRFVAFAATLSVSLLMGSSKTPIGKATGESIDRRSTQFGRWVDKTLHRGNPAIVKQIEETMEANIASAGKQGLQVVRDGAHPDRITSRIFSYIGLDGFYTVITSVTLYAFTRILAPIFGKKAKPEIVAAIQPSTPETARVSKNDLEPAPEAHEKHPRPHVSQTTHHARVHAAPAGQEITA